MSLRLFIYYKIKLKRRTGGDYIIFRNMSALISNLS